MRYWINQFRAWTDFSLIRFSYAYHRSTWGRIDSVRLTIADHFRPLPF